MGKAQSRHVRAREAAERFRAQLPVHLDLVDPATGAPFVFSREDVLRGLIVDRHALDADLQVIGAQFAELARAHRACEYAEARAEVALRSWKAERSNESRSKGAKVTVAQTEAEYRTHPDYEEMSTAPARWKALAGLFDDLKTAFRIKADVMRSISRVREAHEEVEREETLARVDEMSRAQSLSDAVNAAIGR